MRLLSPAGRQGLETPGRKDIRAGIGGRAITQTSDFRNGLVLDIDGQLMRIVEFQHVKPGKGAAFVRTKLKNVETGQVVDKTFRAGERVEEAILEHRKMQYLYNDDENYIFMDRENYEQVSVPPSVVGDESRFLLENQDVSVFIRKGTPITIELPAAVNLKVAEADTWLKGDTSGAATKPVTLETGLKIQVPLFVEKGDTLRVDTRTGRYIERV